MTKKFLVPIILVLIAFGFYFTSENKTLKKKNKVKVQELNEIEFRKKNRNTSLFDTEFLMFSEKTHGKKIEDYTEEDLIEKFETLAQQFPKNSIIPRYYPPDVKAKMIQEEEKSNSILDKLVQKEEVSKEDKIFYYSRRIKTVQDRIEIIEYALTKSQNEFLKDLIKEFKERSIVYENEILKLN
ncbi:MAG: hypothetical protein SFU98_04805 [Leptospiraceae bacterium]|nr:hypothetical protein [Leptospiraceae bacterium]